MTQIRLQPPDPFNFKNPDNWGQWIWSISNLIGSQCIGSWQTDQYPAMLLGGRGRTYFTTLYECYGRREISVRDCRSKIWRIFQSQEECNLSGQDSTVRTRTVNLQNNTQWSSINLLYKSCDYGDMTERICDRLVVGIKDGPMSERVQLIPELTRKIQEDGRQWEAVHEQTSLLRSGGRNRCTEWATLQARQNKHTQRRQLESKAAQNLQWRSV